MTARKCFILHKIAFEDLAENDLFILFDEGKESAYENGFIINVAEGKTYIDNEGMTGIKCSEVGRIVLSDKNAPVYPDDKEDYLMYLINRPSILRKIMPQKVFDAAGKVINLADDSISWAERLNRLSEGR